MHIPQAARATRVLLLVATLAGCGTAESDPQKRPRHTADRPIRIVTTCAMVTDIVRQVAGQHAHVSGLMGEGVDPHLYKPTRSDVKRLTEADLIFYSGLNLEGGLTDLFIRLSQRRKPVYAVTEEIPPSFLREPPEFQGHYDPHVWMDVAAWSQCVQFVAKALAEYDPPHADQYHANADDYRDELTKLDDYVRRTIAGIPQSQRVLVTAHDAFGYFGRAYGIEVRSVQGISTDSEAGVADVNQLVDFLVQRKLPAIFVESSVSSRNMQAVIEGAARQGVDVAVGGELYSDAMGPEGTYEGTYIGMIDHNATLIAHALGGKAPQRGLNGKLSFNYKTD